MRLDPGAPVWRTGVPSVESLAAEDIARRIARIVSVCYALLLVMGLTSEFLRIADAPVWWRVTSVLLALTSVAVMASYRAPGAVIRVLWAVYPVLWALASIAWTAFSRLTASSVSPIPWTWALAPLAISISALRWRLGPALVVGLAPVLFVPPMVNGGLTAGIASITALGVGSPIFAVLVVAARGQLLQNWQVARQLEAEEQSALRELAWREERDRLTALVHDHVLGTLAVAGRGGEATADLIADAQRSIALLGGSGSGGEDSVVLRETLRAVALANGFELILGCPPEEVRFPPEVGEAVVAAVAQAARNSVEHAGHDVTRTMRAEIARGRLEVAVMDDGKGFEDTRVPDSRLGLRTSVLGRMQALPGGSATVDSAPGEGTRVTISWHAPDPASQQEPTPVPDQPAPDLPDIGTVAGVTTPIGRFVLVLCWAAGLLWVELAWPGLPYPGLILFGVGWLLVAVIVGTQPSGSLPAGRTVLLALTPAVAAGCLVLQWSQVHVQETWLLQLGADVAALLALRGRILAAALGTALSAAVVLPLIGRMGELDMAFSLLGVPVVGIIAGTVLHHGLQRTMEANLAFREAGARALSAQQAARDAAERADRLRARIGELGLPSLNALAAGRRVDVRLAEDCRVDAAAIRDLLRAPALATGELADACTRARRRGVQVDLFDDGLGRRALSEHTLARLTEAVAATRTGRITIRMLPEGRRSAVTAVLDDDTVRRLEFAE